MRSDTLAVLSHTHPSITRGGAEISAYALYKGLKSLGHDVHFIAACPEAERDRLFLDGDTEHAIFYNSRDYDTFYHIAPPSTSRDLMRIVENIGAQSLMFHHYLFFGVNTVADQTAAGRRVSMTLHEFLAMCHHHGQMVTTAGQKLCHAAHPVYCGRCYPSSEVQQFEARRRYILNSFADIAAFIAPSRFLMERYIGWGLAAERFHLIENGLLEPAAPSAHAGAPTLWLDDENAGADPLVVGFFGQLNPFKGLDIILEAVERIAADPSTRPIQIRIHGNVVSIGESVQQRFDAAITAGLINYRGAYENAEVGLLMKQCDYVLMASRWWENSPVVIQEAFAAERPLIVPDIGGMAEKVEPMVNGFHFRASDSSDLARVLRRAADGVAPSFTFPVPPTAEGMAQAYLGAIDIPAQSSPGAVEEASQPVPAVRGRRKR